MYRESTPWSATAPNPVTHFERFLSRQLLPHLSDDMDRGIRASAFAPMLDDLDHLEREVFSDRRSRDYGEGGP